MGLLSSAWEPEALVTLCFVFAAAGVFANGGSYSDSIWLGGIGLVNAVPIAIGVALGNSLFGGALLPLFALGAIVYLALLKQWLGPVATVAMVGSMVLLLGA